ncbi:MAG: hypothetical protein C3F06_11825 [Candidatus Methanoperedenaceae archaeon]|nr:MAG: hypothetical protein C3F06_11825 [Candidatus Methanoperedenaceae archaeon]
MIEIRNKLNQRLIINLLSGTIDILAKSTAVIPDDDFSSAHLQNLLRSGKVILVSRMEDKSKTKKKKGESPKKKKIEAENKLEVEISEGATESENPIEINPDE